jgi:hypothetical protein
VVDTKKVITLLVIVFVLFFIIQSPNDAANAVRSIGHGIGHMFDQFAEFLKKLA